MKCSHVWRTVFFFFFCFNTLSITPITFAQLVEMKLVRTQCPMTGQHLHAWHVNDEKGGGKTKHMLEIPHWKTLPVNYPSQSHWPQQTPPLADRWPGKCILQKLERLGARYLFSKNGQPSRSLHERRAKYIPTTRQGGLSEHLAELKRIISVADFGRQTGVQYWLVWPQNTKT